MVRMGDGATSLSDCWVMPLVLMAVWVVAAAGFTEREGGQLETRGRNRLPRLTSLVCRGVGPPRPA